MLWDTQIIEKIKSWFNRTEPIPNPDKLCLERIAQVLDLIESRNKEGLKSLFSSQALVEVNDIDQQIDDLFNFYEGTLLSCEYKSMGESDSIVQGRVKKIYFAGFYVQTDEQKYKISLKECYYDNLHKDEGLERIVIKKVESFDEPWASGFKEFGIFIY